MQKKYIISGNLLSGPRINTHDHRPKPIPTQPTHVARTHTILARDPNWHSSMCSPLHRIKIIFSITQSVMRPSHFPTDRHASSPTSWTTCEYSVCSKGKIPKVHLSGKSNTFLPSCKTKKCYHESWWWKTFNLYVRMKPNSLFKRTAGGCLLKSSPGLSGRVTPAELTCTNLDQWNQG